MLAMLRGNSRDIVGNRYGRLLVVAQTDRRRGRHIIWECKCDCGATCSASSDALRSGDKSSCGCLRREVAAAQGRSQPPARHKLTASSWHSMLSRCEKPTDPSFYLYGARGIRVCGRWHTFENFLADMSERPIGTTIDRIDNDGNYEPSNTRWATADVQARNKRPPGTVRQVNRRRGYRRRKRVDGVLV